MAMWYQKMTRAMDDVLTERNRQMMSKNVGGEAWSQAHDDEHTQGELAKAAACYTLSDYTDPRVVNWVWPWDRKWWKPKSRRRDLVIAGALIIAEIERLDRAEEKARTPK